MSCPHCEELEDRIAFLESELSLSIEAEGRERLRKALGLAPQTTAVLVALSAAKGRVVSTYDLQELLDVETPMSKVVAVYVSKIRAVLGKGAIVNVWGQGYRLSAEAMAYISAILQPKVAEAA